MLCFSVTTAAAGNDEPAVATTEGVQPEDSVDTIKFCKLFTGKLKRGVFVNNILICVIVKTSKLRLSFNFKNCLHYLASQYFY